MKSPNEVNLISIHSDTSEEFLENLKSRGLENAKVGDVYGLKVVDISDTEIGFNLVRIF